MPSAPTARPPDRVPAPGDHDSPGYDVRLGAQAYAPIIGNLGGFVVAAVVLVFALPRAKHGDSTLLGLGTGLLVLALISSLLAAFILAGLGAERELTPNLPAAALHAGVTAAVGVVAMVAAFEVLSAVYLPSAKPLFVMITIGAEVASAVFVALVLGDAWLASRNHPAKRGTHWLARQEDAARVARSASLAATIALGLGAGLYALGVKVSLGPSGARFFVGAGIVLAIGSALIGVLRTWHPSDGKYLGVNRTETILALGLLTAYLVMLTLCLP